MHVRESRCVIWPFLCVTVIVAPVAAVAAKKGTVRGGRDLVRSEPVDRRTASPQKAWPAFARKDVAAVELTCILMVRPSLAPGMKWPKNDTHCTARTASADISRERTQENRRASGCDEYFRSPSDDGCQERSRSLLSQLAWLDAATAEIT